MLKLFAILFGLIFICIGILGFLPDFKTNELLFGFFMVNPIHNVFHLGTGVLALFCGLSSKLACKIFFIFFGLLYIAIGIYGFYLGSEMLFDLVAINQADHILHLAVGAISLYLGIAIKSK